MSCKKESVQALNESIDKMQGSWVTLSRDLGDSTGVMDGLKEKARDRRKSSRERSALLILPVGERREAGD